MSEFRFPPLKISDTRMDRLPEMASHGDGDNRNGSAPNDGGFAECSGHLPSGGRTVTSGDARTTISHAVGEINLTAVQGPRPGMVAMVTHAPRYESRRIGNIQRLVRAQFGDNWNAASNCTDHVLAAMVAASHRRVPRSAQVASVLVNKPSESAASYNENWESELCDLPDQGVKEFQLALVNNHSHRKIYVGTKIPGYHQRTSYFTGSTARGDIAPCGKGGQAYHEFWYWPKLVPYEWVFWIRQYVKSDYQGSIYLDWKLNYYFRHRGRNQTASWYHYLSDFRND